MWLPVVRPVMVTEPSALALTGTKLPKLMELPTVERATLTVLPVGGVKV